MFIENNFLKCQKQVKISLRQAFSISQNIFTDWVNTFNLLLTSQLSWPRRRQWRNMAFFYQSILMPNSSKYLLSTYSFNAVENDFHIILPKILVLTVILPIYCLIFWLGNAYLYHFICVIVYHNSTQLPDCLHWIIFEHLLCFCALFSIYTID